MLCFRRPSIAHARVARPLMLRLQSTQRSYRKHSAAMLCAGGFALTAAAGAAYFSQTTSEPSVADDLRAYVSYALLSQPRLVDVAKRVVVWLHEHGLSFVYARPLKATLYRQFCG